jgi:uncharacterized protein with NAD-binding domain and iron-sulfur cluster
LPAPLSIASETDDGRTKVAVLGGGAGGLTAAFELTRHGSFDVTVYQLGWRLGGKGTSGRNLSLGARIEEHGLHLWFGFYANAFALMRDVYEELARPRGSPLATIGEAFRACDQIVLYSHDRGGWHAHPFHFPDIGVHPWDVDPMLPAFWTVVKDAVQRSRGLIAALGGPLEETEYADEQLAEAQTLAAEQEYEEGFPAHWALKKLVSRLRKACQSLLEQWEERLTAHPDLRMAFTTIDAFTAMAVGIVADDLLGRGFDAVDNCDWGEWLRHHGASRRWTVPPDFIDWAPTLRSVYDVAFCFPEGDTGNPSAAAGTATSDLLRLQFTYQGAMAYKMAAGMGDAIFAPLYQVLRRRGVKFRFFHAVTRLGLAENAPRVEEIDVVPQVGLRVAEYDPLVCVKELPCWPNEPLWGQLEDGAPDCGTRFETELNPLGRDHTTLRVGTDFDEVVLAIPVGGLGEICEELTEREDHFRAMVEGSATVQTQAFQLWLREPPARLGFGHSSDSVVSSYVEPLDTYCDMGHLLPAEHWPEQDEVKGLAYFCGVLRHRSGETPVQARERAKREALSYLHGSIGNLWPGVGGPGSPALWPVLADPLNRAGEQRFDAQYWRANVVPWELYVTTPAGSTAQRLPADESGFDNLVLAGDWTRTSINGGCVEAAVMSGMQAARKLSSVESTIVGEQFNWLTAE